jgi:hypothetical protein
MKRNKLRTTPVPKKGTQPQRGPNLVSQRALPDAAEKPGFRTRKSTQRLGLGRRRCKRVTNREPPGVVPGYDQSVS